LSKVGVIFGVRFASLCFWKLVLGQVDGHAVVLFGVSGHRMETQMPAPCQNALKRTHGHGQVIAGHFSR